MDQLSGSTPLKIRYVKTDLLVAPKGTSSALGTLKKGAVVIITEDYDPYYYKVRLDNGLEGYVYKDSGVQVIGVSPTKMPSLNGVSDTSSVQPAAKLQPAEPTNGLSSRTAPSRTVSSRAIGSTGSRLNNPARVVGAGPSVVITSAEIAVFDKPGITGRQVAKIRRNDRAALVGDDGSFYQIRLTSGIVGYIPRYAAEQR